MKILNKNLITVCILFLGIFGLAVNVSAHVLKTDGSIGAVLHIDPADSPIAGEQTIMHFLFRDTTNKFEEANCRCLVTVVENGKTIYSKDLFEDDSRKSLFIPLLVYTFPEKGIYTLNLQGSPRPGFDFQKFNLSYQIRVEDGVSDPGGQSNTTTKHTHGPLPIFILIAIAATYFLYIHDTDLQTKDRNKINN